MKSLYTAIDSVMSGYVYLRPQETRILLSSMLKKRRMMRKPAILTGC